MKFTGWGWVGMGWQGQKASIFLPAVPLFTVDTRSANWEAGPVLDCWELPSTPLWADQLQLIIQIPPAGNPIRFNSGLKWSRSEWAFYLTVGRKNEPWG